MGLTTKKRGVMKKKALFFTMDAIFATLLIVAGFLFVSKTLIVDQPTENLEYASQDLLTALNNIPVSSVNHPFIQAEIANGNINPENSVLEQIAAYWALNNTHDAEDLSRIVLQDVIPPNMGLRIEMSPDVLYETLSPRHGSSIAARRMISGVEKGQALSGSSSVGYLRSIHDKKSSAYAYFGGFYGQGNFTVQVEELPSDVDSTRVRDIILEGAFERDFTLLINDAWCADLTPNPGNMTADRWHLPHCNGSIVAGINNMSVHFDDLNQAYVGGGFVRIDYETDTFHTNTTYDLVRFDLPQVEGIVNLYDAFYVDGLLNSLHVHLYYFANTSANNNTFYMTIGNTTVLSDDNSTGLVTATLTNDYLSSLLNYSTLSATTIPFRIGFENLTYTTHYIGNADVALITDTSGSMSWNFTHDGWSAVGELRNCDDALINHPSTQRISVAKCLANDFSTSILGVTDNMIGLVDYSSNTNSAIGPTDNLTVVFDTIGTSIPLTGYSAVGGTCICCGAISAYDMLTADLERTIIIPRNSVWRYNNNHLDGYILNDSNGRPWYAPDYDDNSWSSGPAILGHDAGGGIAIATEMGFDLVGDRLYADLWDMAADSATPEVDFTSGINTTGNTYGISGAHDGWDWEGGVFDYATTFSTIDWHTGRLRMITPSGGWWWFVPSSSGAYGISIVITDEHYDNIVAGGRARLSFNYEWDSWANVFEDSDQVWIKGRWTSPHSGVHNLGWHLDDEHTNGDSWEEIDARNNPNSDIINGFYSQDITQWIEGPGTYYLEAGGKLRRNAANEWGTFYLDNFLLFITNKTDYYYLRHNVTISNLDTVRRGVINVLSDDHVKIYVNGNLIFDDWVVRDAQYWSQGGIEVLASHFALGENTVAVELRNTLNDAAFDLELVGINDTRKKAMLVMTDGQANERCTSRLGWVPDMDGVGGANTASDHAVRAACMAAEDYGILVYSVGFSDTADETTLRAIANCGTGFYRQSSDVEELQVFYQDVVYNILELSRQSQSIVVTSGTPDISDLFAGSYILVNQSTLVDGALPNEIELVFQTPPFTSCEEQITIPEGLRVSKAHVTSYSGDHWTSLLKVNDQVVFNLSEFSANYTHLGDPFIVSIPPHLLLPGTHNITLYTGDNSLNTTGCSLNNTLIYRGYVSSATARSSVVDRAIGCIWEIEFEDFSFSTFSVPTLYVGSRTCSYTNASISYDSADAYDVAVHSLLSQLDFNKNGRVFINLDKEDLEIIVSVISDVPYLWGPAILSLEVWQ